MENHMKPIDIVNNVHQEVFFAKLKQAGCDITDANDRTKMLKYADDLAVKYPRGTAAATNIKSAAFNPRFDSKSDGSAYSDEVLMTTEALMKSSGFVDAASEVLTNAIYAH
jgi:hypothetical protein